MRWLLLALLLLSLPLPSGAARAAEVTDATGRSVAVPDDVARVLPAGEPATVLLTALAPDLMLGVTGPLSPEARAWLGPDAALLPQVPRLTGKQDVTEAIRALHPGLIVDYGDVTPAYVDLAKRTQERLGVPVLLLDGSLGEVPHVLRVLGTALHRQARAETLARLAEAMLALPVPARQRTVMYLRGADDLRAAAPGTGATEVFARLGWTVLAPPEGGNFRPVTLPQIALLDPEVIVFADAKMRGVVAKSDAWGALRAVRTGMAVVAPSLPFGWVEQPPSLNRLLGLAWLGGHDSMALAASFGAVVYGHAPTTAQLQTVGRETLPIGR